MAMMLIEVESVETPSAARRRLARMRKLLDRLMSREIKVVPQRRMFDTAEIEGEQ